MPLFDRKDKDSLTINLLNAIGEWHKKYREHVAEFVESRTSLSREAEEVLLWAGHLREAIGADRYRRIIAGEESDFDVWWEAYMRNRGEGALKSEETFARKVWNAARSK